MHMKVFHEGTLSNSVIGRCDIPMEALLKATSPTLFQLVDPDNFSKVAGHISVQVSFVGTGAPSSPVQKEQPVVQQ